MEKLSQTTEDINELSIKRADSRKIFTPSNDLFDNLLVLNFCNFITINENAIKNTRDKIIAGIKRDKLSKLISVTDTLEINEITHNENVLLIIRRFR